MIPTQPQAVLLHCTPSFRASQYLAGATPPTRCSAVGTRTAVGRQETLTTGLGLTGDILLVVDLQNNSLSRHHHLVWRRISRRARHPCAATVCVPLRAAALAEQSKDEARSSAIASPAGRWSGPQCPGRLPDKLLSLVSQLIGAPAGGAALCQSLHKVGVPPPAGRPVVRGRRQSERGLGSAPASAWPHV